METKHILSPASLLVALAAGAAGIAIGFWAARDPQAARRAVGAVAGTLGRTRQALAETLEHVADLWAEAREETNALIEAEKLAQAAGATGATAATSAARAGRKRPAGTSSRRRRATPPVEA